MPHPICLSTGKDMSRILITGCGGFTGRHLAKQMATLDHEVHAVVHESETRAIPGAHTIHRCNIVDRAALSHVVRDVAPQKVIHLAAISFVPHGDLDEMYRTNILGTRYLLGALAASPTPPEAILVASSANVYGDGGGRFAETSPIAPFNDYGATKVATETVCHLFDGQLPIILVRPFNYTGRGQSPNFLVPKIVDHARRAEQEIALGNIDVARDISDVRTVIDAYQRLLDTPASYGRTFNICSGQPTALRSIVDMVGEIAGNRLQVVVNPAFVRPNEARLLCGDPGLLESVIGPLRHIPLEQTLRWMLDG